MKAAAEVQDAFVSEIRTRAEILARADAEIRTLVTVGRAKGVTWPTIAGALGVTVRIARARFALTEGERRNRVRSRTRAAEIRAKAASV